MYTADRQRAQPYLNKMNGPLYEQWYLLHHRMLRIITNHIDLADYMRRFFYYAQLLAEYTYQSAAELPVNIPIDLLWQAGAQVYKPVALTCYLFETQPDEAFPPAPAEPRPEDIDWEEISGLDGPQRARWKRDSLRFREYQAFPGVSSRVSSVMDKHDLHATIYIEDVSQNTPWFLTRFVIYMVIGAMLGIDGYEIVHAASIATDPDTGALLVGSPGSGKSTLVVACLDAGLYHLADDVLFLGKDDGIVKTYAFPEDIGVRQGTVALLEPYQFHFMQSLSDDQRQKRFIDIQRHFHNLILPSCPIRVMFFLQAKNRDAQFRAEKLSPAHAVATLMQEYISRQRAEAGEADFMFDIFSDAANQATSYQIWLSPDIQHNAQAIKALLLQHRQNA